jgi:hypothetical protein
MVIVSVLKQNNKSNSRKNNNINPKVKIVAKVRNGKDTMRQLVNRVDKKLSNRRNTKQSTIPKINKTKELRMVGVDYLSTLSSARPRELDDGVKLIFTRQVTPSMFPQTKLQTTSRTYQKYKFMKFNVSFKPQLADSVNGVFIAYFDLDVNDKPILANKENLMRLAQSHQGAVQRSANKAWSVNMPVLGTDDYFFTGNQGDDRLTKQATLYIYQVGALSNFNGEQVDKPLDMGILSINWECIFTSPQMSNELSVYDGVSQKDVIRTFKNLVTYVNVTVAGITNEQGLPGTRFRIAKIPLLPAWLNKGGKGSYMIVRLPLASTISNSVKGIHSLIEPYTYDKYKTDLGSKYTAGLFNSATLSNYIDQAFQILKGGIKTAKLVYDVITTVASLFVANSSIGTQTNVTYASDIDTNTAFVPVGANVAHWDGINVPFVQDLIEFQDNAHAVDPAITIGYPLTILIYKLDEALIPDTVVESVLPRLPPPS